MLTAEQDFRLPATLPFSRQLSFPLLGIEQFLLHRLWNKGTFPFLKANKPRNKAFLRPRKKEGYAAHVPNQIFRPIRSLFVWLSSLVPHTGLKHRLAFLTSFVSAECLNETQSLLSQPKYILICHPRIFYGTCLKSDIEYLISILGFFSWLERVKMNKSVTVLAGDRTD